MKKVILYFAAFAALISCAKENGNGLSAVESFPITLQATAASSDDQNMPDKKTALVDGSLVHWVKGDQIKVGFPVSSTLSSTVGDKCGVFTSTFENESSVSAFFSISDWNWSYKYNSSTGEYSADSSAYVDTGLAMYPSSAYFYSERTGIRGVYYNTQIYYTLTAEQTAVENSFETDLCFSIAEVNKDDFNDNSAHLAFKNECALIKIVLPEGVNDVASVNVASVSNIAPLAGKFNYSNTTGAPSFPITFAITDGVESLNLNAPENQTLTAGGTYYMVVCPGTHTSGLAFTFTNTEGKTCRKVVSNQIDLVKSEIDEFKFKTITYEEAIDYTKAQVGDYFYSDGSFSTDQDETKNLVGVVFYKGSKHMEDDETLAASDYKHCNHGLVVSVESAGNGVLMSQKYTFSGYGLNTYDRYVYTDLVTSVANATLMTGYNNTKAIIDCVNDNGITSAAVDALNRYNGNLSVEDASCWFLPTIADFKALSAGATIVNEKLVAADKTKISGKYWTVTEEEKYGAAAAVYNMESCAIIDVPVYPTWDNSNNYDFLPIFAF